MNKIFILAIVSSMIIACGGSTPDFDNVDPGELGGGNAPPVNPEPTTDPSPNPSPNPTPGPNNPGNPPAMPPSEPPAPAPTTGPSDGSTDPAVLLAGKMAYEEQCATCHDDPEQDGIDGEGRNGNPRIGVERFASVVGLANVISTTMPKPQPSRCEGECATNIAAFIANAYRADDSGSPVDAMPTARFVMMKTGDRMISVDASTSTDDVGISRYSWNFGDGNTAEGAMANHMFENFGEYTVTLTVTDTANQQATSDGSVNFVAEVVNQPPVAAFSVSVNGKSVQFSGSDSTDPDQDTLSYQWNFGDGQNSTEENPQHTYANSGSFTVSLTVSDGRLSDEHSQAVVIADDPIPDSDGDGFKDPDDLCPLQSAPESLDGCPDIDYDLDNGKLEYANRCASCHDDQGSAIQGTSTAYDNIINAEGQFDCQGDRCSTTEDLTTYIIADMPYLNADACVGKCAQDIAHFIIETFDKQNAPTGPGAQACVNPINYGARQLKLLTREEYQNTLEDLLGINYQVEAEIPFDTVIHGYSNNAMASVTDTYADAFYKVAEKAAQWSADNNFAGVVNCEGKNASACASDFINGFGMRAYRRPLTAAERSRVAQFFEDRLSGGDIDQGIKFGIITLLTSPQFIYRSEMGVLASDVGNGAGEPGSEETVLGKDFSTKSTGGASGDSGWNIWANGNVSEAMSFSGANVLDVYAKGDIALGVWPTMEVHVGAQIIATETVDSASYVKYSYNIENVVGEQNVSIHFTNDIKQGDEDRNLHLEKVVLTSVLPSDPGLGNLPALDPDAYVLTAYELATYLSYTYAGTTPDPILLEAAKNGELASDDNIAAQISRLLASPKAKQRLANFAAQWLGTDSVMNANKDAEMFPDYTDDVQAAMANEVRELFAHIFFDESQPFDRLFNANYSFLNEALAEFYGVDGISGADMRRVVNTGRPSGILGTGAFLATYAGDQESSPIKRAVNIRERLLCHHIDPPPANIAIGREDAANDLAGVDLSTITNREYTHRLTNREPCSTCHKEKINPLGFGLEDYDAVGMPRISDVNGLSVNAMGSLIGVNSISDGMTVAFNGTADLATKLAEVDAPEACFVENMFRFSMGFSQKEIDKNNPGSGTLEDDEKSAYSCAVEKLQSTMASQQGDPKAMFSGIGVLDLVRFRKQRDRSSQ